MSYRFLSHTADIRLLLENNNLKGLFKDALLGMNEVIINDNDLIIKDDQVEIEIDVKGSNLTELLINFLSDILFESQTKKAIFHNLNFKEFTDTSIKTSLNGSMVKAFSDEIKAVTYYEAEVKKDEKGKWSTVIVFDV